jgi:hypothetical protein
MQLDGEVKPLFPHLGKETLELVRILLAGADPFRKGQDPHLVHRALGCCDECLVDRGSEQGEARPGIGGLKG